MVVDTSVILATILGEEFHERVEDLTINEDLIAPAVLPYEVGNAFSRMAKRSRLSLEEIYEGIDAFFSIPVRLVAGDLTTVIEIAIKYGIYAYDAYFLETAMRLQKRLITLDLEMRRIARRMGLSVVEV